MYSSLSWKEIKYTKYTILWKEQKVSYLKLRGRGREKSNCAKIVCHLLTKYLRENILIGEKLLSSVREKELNHPDQ